jgi:hypothetical protein
MIINYQITDEEQGVVEALKAETLKAEEVNVNSEK